MATPKITQEFLAEQMRRGPSADSLRHERDNTPMDGELITVPVDQLRPYEKNPRQSKNPRYEEIKASIRDRGLDSPPQVTKRPGDDFYIIANGGNTRLSILKELYTETQREEFLIVTCQYKAWKGEINALAGHLVENEMRGQLTFIEKALGIRELKALYEAEPEAGGKPLSQRKLSERLKKDGISVSQPILARMFDCLTNIYPSLHKLLIDGMGKPQIERLCVLHSDLQAIFNQYGKPEHTQEEFDKLWFDNLKAYDDAKKYHYLNVEDRMVGEMQALIGRSFNMLKEDFSQMHGELGAIPKPEDEPFLFDDQHMPDGIGLEADVELLQSRLPAKDQVWGDPNAGRTILPGLPPFKQNQDASSQNRTAPIAKQQEPARKPTSVPEPASQAATPAAQDAPYVHPFIAPIDMTEEEKEAKRKALTISPHQSESISFRHGKEILTKMEGLYDKPDTRPYAPFEELAPRAIPVLAGGRMADVSDIWLIDAMTDTLPNLRMNLLNFARQLLSWGGASEDRLCEVITPSDDGLGFTLMFNDLDTANTKEVTVGYLLGALLRISDAFNDDQYKNLPVGLLSAALIGGDQIKLPPFGVNPSKVVTTLPDQYLVVYFRMIRLARRLVEKIKQGVGNDLDGNSNP